MQVRMSVPTIVLRSQGVEWYPDELCTVDRMGCRLLDSVTLALFDPQKMLD